MPVQDGRADLLRRITGLEGSVEVAHTWVVRADYGEVRPWVHRQQVAGHEVIVATAGPDRLVLRGPRLPKAIDHRHADVFTVEAGDVLSFSTTWFPSHVDVPAGLVHDDRIAQTIQLSEAWAAQCRVDVPHADIVVRSLVTLRLLTHEQTGGIVAAPTTSLPEDFGGERNWDYRYCWLRDAALTLESLVTAGYTEEASLWRNWLLRAVAGDPEDLQVMYTVDGARRLPERTLDHLPGYEELPAGADRQRRRRPAPDGRAGRGDDLARRGAPRRSRRGRRRLAAAGRPRRRPRRQLGPARQRHLGDPRVRAGTSPTPG